MRSSSVAAEGWSTATGRRGPAAQALPSNTYTESRLAPAALKPPMTYRLPPAAAAPVSSTGAGRAGSCRCGGGGLGGGDGELIAGGGGDGLGAVRAAGWFDAQAAATITYARPTSRLVRFIPSHNPSIATALSLTHLGSLMRGVRSVDEVGADERAASLAKRSIKKASKLWALDLAIRCMDLTTLEGADTRGKVAAMCAKAIRPQPGDESIPSVAAVCIYPAMIPHAATHVRGSGVRVASVATAFPSGQTFMDVKVAETREAVAAGADEIDMVIDRGAFLSGDFGKVYDEICAVKDACGGKHLKVILETGEL